MPIKSTFSGASSRAFGFTSGGETFVESLEYLVVAGGGAGGCDNLNATACGGGGAGGMKTSASFAVSAGSTYTVTVGAGGTGVANRSVPGNSGANSVFDSVTSTGVYTWMCI